MPSSKAAPTADPKARAALVLAILNGSTSVLDASQRHGVDGGLLPSKSDSRHGAAKTKLA